MNLPNKLSLSRILVVPLFLVLLLPRELMGIQDPPTLGILYMAALVMVIAVAITDWLDGKIARERKLTSNLGKLLDPLADKVFVTAALVALVEIGMIPAWAVVIIITREFLITGLRQLALESGRVISADRLGKHKTGWQLALIIGSILMLGLRSFLAEWLAADPANATMFGWISTGIVWFILAVTLVLTIASGWNYTVRNLDLLKL